MQEYQNVVTRKGQITIPAEIRRALNIKEGDKVAFTMEQGEVKLPRTGSVVAATAGALQSNMPALLPEEERKAAEQAIAEDVMARMGSPRSIILAAVQEAEIALDDAETRSRP